MVAPDSRTPVRKGELLGVSLVAALVAAGWFALSFSLGAVGIARNDDWSFIQNAFQFAETGDFVIGGWVQMMLIGQLLLALPVISVFGESVAALQALVAVLGAVFLVCAYVVLRNFLPAIWAGAATAIAAFSSIFGLLSVSFMTDIPAAAFQLLALGIAYRAFRNNSIAWPTLLLATAAALVGVSIREYAVVALAAIWLTALRLCWGGRNYRAFIAWTISIGVLIGLMMLWRSGQITVPDSQLGLHPFGIRYLPWWLLSSGWLLLPAVAAANPVSVARRAWSSSKILTGIVLVLVAAAVMHTRLGFLGTYFSLSGGYAEVLRGIPTPVLPEPWGVAVSVASGYAVTVLALMAVAPISRVWVDKQRALARPVSTVSLAATFICLTVLIYAVVPLFANVAMFDRYFIAVLPMASGMSFWWLLSQGLMWKEPKIPVAAVLVLVTLTNLVISAATTARDATRWELASQAAALLGFDKGNIDGGFDYFAFNAEGIPQPEGVKWTWWTAYLGDRAVCATLTYEDVGVSDVAAGPEPGQVPLIEEIVSVPLGRDQRLTVLEGPDSC